MGIGPGIEPCRDAGPGIRGKPRHAKPAAIAAGTTPSPAASPARPLARLLSRVRHQTGTFRRPGLADRSSGFLDGFRDMPSYPSNPADSSRSSQLAGIRGRLGKKKVSNPGSPRAEKVISTDRRAPGTTLVTAGDCQPIPSSWHAPSAASPDVNEKRRPQGRRFRFLSF